MFFRKESCLCVYIFSGILSTEGTVQEITSDAPTSEEQFIEGKEPHTEETGRSDEALAENVSIQETEVIGNGFTKTVEEEDDNEEEEEGSSTLPEQSDFTESLHISEDDETPETEETPEVEETPEDDNLFEEEEEEEVKEVEYVVQAPVQPSYKSQLSPQSPRMVEIPEETISMPVSSNQSTTSVLGEFLLFWV